MSLTLDGVEGSVDLTLAAEARGSGRPGATPRPSDEGPEHIVRDEDPAAGEAEAAAGHLHEPRRERHGEARQVRVFLDA
jgi:hypothetical protein